MDKIRLEELTINALYNDGETKYEVPIYQRNYAWEEDQVKTLIQDIYDAFKAKPQKAAYYIGTLVTFDRGDKLYEVIDGQQRLTTIYLTLTALNIQPKNELTYRSRKKSKETLKHITNLDMVENVDAGIRNGFEYAKKAINEIVTEDEMQGFRDYFTNNVHILHYVVPKDVDLNHYFEVMNSRGEQLEKHEIVKAELCHCLTAKEKDTAKEKEMETFSRIWEACSMMNVYIQQKFDSADIFGAHMNEYHGHDFDSLPSLKSETMDKNSPKDGCIDEPKDIEKNDEDKSKTKDTKSGFSINALKDGDIGALKDDDKNDKNDTFQPIIDFPNFLLIVLKITRMDEDGFVPADFTLDDKELINEFNKADKTCEFAKKFTMNLLKAKYLLDNYIIHHTNGEDLAGDNPWKLQQYTKEGNKTYAKNTSPDSRMQDELVHLLSMFEVAFTARQRKNYLFYCLLHLFSDTDLGHYLTFLQALANKYFIDIYLNPDNLSASNNRPKPNSFDNTILRNNEITLEISNCRPDFNRIYGDGLKASKGIQLFVFNYMDYKIWHKYASEMRGRQYKKGSRERDNFFKALGCSDFDLDTFDSFYFSRTRKSLEHFYPQAKAGDGERLSQDNINCFGNYAMIGADANSSGSNWDPHTKLNHYADKKHNQVSVASLKFKIMMQICEDNYKKMLCDEINRAPGMEWDFDDIVNHQNKMLSILLDDVK